MNRNICCSWSDENILVTPLVTQISWTNHLLIMSGCKSDEEREFYMRLCIKENYSKRQLERQIESAYYERYMWSMLVAQYQVQLPDKSILQKKLQELVNMPEMQE